MSLVDGYNLPVRIEPSPGTFKTNQDSHYLCKPAGCEGDLNPHCPIELVVRNAAGYPIACRSPCLTFKLDEFCCPDMNATTEACKSTFWKVDYSAIFKHSCADVYAYAFDQGSSTFVCRGAPLTDYIITFCPQTS